jgi:protease-4
MSTASQPAPPVQQIVIQPRESLFGRFGKLLLVALAIAILFCVGMYNQYHSYTNPTTGPQERLFSGEATAQKKIAIITVAGTIYEGDTFVKQQIDRVRKDPNVVGVVLRINSPGGTVTYSDYLYHHLRQLAEGESREGKLKGEPLPLVVSMGSVCASGGYFLAMAVGDTPNSIFAEPATITGSIGVIIPHYDLSGLLEDWKIKDDSIASHELKDMGALTKPMSDEERALFQNLVDEMLAEFKERVKAGRPRFNDKPEDLDAVATGQIFTANQAKELGLIDDIGFTEKAVERAAELAKVKLSEVRVVEYRHPPSALGSLLGEAPSTGSRSVHLDMASLVDMATPRAYYLCTWLPAVVSTSR